MIFPYLYQFNEYFHDSGARRRAFPCGVQNIFTVGYILYANIQGINLCHSKFEKNTIRQDSSTK